MAKQSGIFRLFSRSSSWFLPPLALQTVRVGCDWDGKQERVGEKALGCLSVNIPRGESLCHRCVKTCSLNSSLFQGYRPPHQVSHYGNAVMHVISQKIQFGIDALLPVSICPLEKTEAGEQNAKQSGSDRLVKEVIVSDMRHWRPLTFTLTQPARSK